MNPPGNDAPATHETPRQMVQRLCDELGFALFGIAHPQPTEHGDELTRWLADGKHGEMGYLQTHTPMRIDPRNLMPEAKSIICVADRYHSGSRDRRRLRRGRVARYARGEDYHRVIRKRLHRLSDALSAAHPDHLFRTCVDTAPILEREVAVAAGLGAIGKHTLLIEPGVGSWLLLGEILTSLPLEPSRSSAQDICKSCTRCIDACPTDAITPYTVDATRCISYLTIEHRSAIDEQFHEAIGDWIFGCDICQEVCPHSQPTRRARRANVHDAYVSDRDSFDLLEVLGWTEQDRRDALVRSAMKRAKLAMWKRNAIIAATNTLLEHDDPPLHAAILRCADDPSEEELVRMTARSSVARLARARAAR